MKSQMQKQMVRSFSRAGLLAAGLLAMLAWQGGAGAANMNLANVPPEVGAFVEPNVMFTLDDSGSMGWEVMPDTLRNISSTTFPSSGSWSNSNTYSRYYDSTSANVAQIRSPSVNGIYYDPSVRYLPWSNSDGTLMPNASPSCANYDPMNPNTSTCVDFTTQKTITVKTGGSKWNPTYTTYTFWPADYYRWDGAGSQTSISSYTHVAIQPGVATYTGSANRTDCAAAPTCTYAEEIQNYANWFQYYRERVMTAKAGIGRAFAAQPATVRVGYGTINTGSRTIDGVTSPGTVLRGVRHFSGTDRTAFFTWLYNETVSGSTPLRRAMDYVGRYYMRSDNEGPWSDIPGTVNTTPDSACRQSYHILMTDGYWNGSNPNYVTTNVDGTSRTVTNSPSSYNYSAVPPYTDAYSVTLADVAMYYWNHDLRPNVANYVKPNDQDPAFWQHMVNFTVGLGLDGTLAYPGDWPALQLPVSDPKHLDWPQAQSNSATAIDDLWHAAVNSHGQYFSAKNPTTFANAMKSALSNIQQRTGSASSASLDGLALATTRYIYIPRYITNRWVGDLFCAQIDLTKVGVNAYTTPTWHAQTAISAQNWDTGRQIVTYKPGTGGVPFRWANLNITQQNDLRINPSTAATDSVATGQNRVKWLRGAQIAGMRSRINSITGNLELLGDIIDSSPVYVGKPSEYYNDYWGLGAPENSAPYSGFKSSNANRAERIYVGANDGMLHAINAAPSGGGNEVFAYIPNAVMPNLSRLTDPNYSSSHRNYVDASPVVHDVFYGGAWHSVLVGGLGTGGQGMYALDVTDPAAATETTAAAKVLWEFDDSSDADLGYTLVRPSIVRMRNGKWAAIFGNGYNNMVADANTSATGDAVVYVVDIETGAVLRKFDTQHGLLQSTANPQIPNGISKVAAITPYGDGIVDYIYAGDLQGNMWKIDVSSADPTKWDFAFKAGNKPAPLFTATDASGAQQPITGGIDVARHPRLGGYIVYFGTGKFLELTDNSRTKQQTQTFYAVWDNGKSGIQRKHLLEQKVLEEQTSTQTKGKAGRITSNYPIRWHTGNGLPTGNPPTDHMGWFIDLANHDPRVTFDNQGERFVSTPVVLGGRVIFTSYIPALDPCAALATGGDSWLWELNAEAGSKLDQGSLDIRGKASVDANDKLQATFDYNGDGKIDSNDSVYAGAAKTLGTRSGEGPLIGMGGERKLISGSSGDIETIAESKPPAARGRQSWMRLQ